MRKFGMTFWIPLMLLILSGIGFRLSFLQQSIVSQGYRTSKKPNLNGTGFRTEDAALFYALLDSGLITPMPDDRRIALPSPDAILVERADLAKKSDRAATEPDDIGTRERLVRSLYNSYAGFVVQSQVRLWNDAHYFTAVRDDRAKHTNQRDNQWRTYNAASSRSKIRVGKRVPVYFGFVNNGRLRPHFSDWLTAHPDSGPVEFRTRIKLDQETELNVQLVGKPLSIFPQATLKPRCPEIEDCTLDRSTAYSVSYSLPKGDHELRFTALPLLSKELRIPGLKIRRAGIAGKFHWDDLPQKAAPTNNLFKITASDGTLLAAENGTPSDFSEQNGLIPLIGFSRQDTYSLSGIMARSFVPADVFSCRLTIDPEIQHSAQQTLTNMVESFWPEDDYADERRGAVVILDADTGAILAVAGKPLPPRGTHPWDLASFAKTYPLKNPLTVRSWQSLDKHTTPGSTFKTAVAISAIKMSGEKKNVDQFMDGWPNREFKKWPNRAGLSLDCAVYQPTTGDCYSPTKIPQFITQKISNFNKQPLRRVFGNNKLAGSCDETSEVHKSVLGLKEAIRDSVNIWFTRLAILVDGNKARQFDEAIKALKRGDPPPGFPQFQLVKTAQQLGFGETPMDLASNFPPEIKLTRLVYNAGVHEGDVLYANPGKLNLMDSQQRGLEWILAQNAIGQGMTASPLQMARLAAAIATEKRINPYLIEQFGDNKLNPSQAAKLRLPKKKLNLLRQGMKAAVEIGTARRAFAQHPDVCRIYGKTGTANVGDLDQENIRVQSMYHTAWFIGWREPEKVGEQRLAFACMVTHAHGERNTGGEICAPIMAEIFNNI